LVFLLFPVSVSAQLVNAATNSTEKIFYDTSRITVYWHKRDTTVWVKALTIKLEAFQAGTTFATLDDIPLRYVTDFSFRELKPSDVGTCTFPCSPAFKPILTSLIAQEIERVAKSIAARERYIDSLFPPRRAWKKRELLSIQFRSTR
jgi:hypothetical protein